MNPPVPAAPPYLFVVAAATTEARHRKMEAMREVRASRVGCLLPGQAASSRRGVGGAHQRPGLPARRRPRAPHAGPVSTGPAGRPGWFALSAITIGILLVLLAYPRRAGAHAQFVRSQPANGSTVAAAPPVVRLWFDEEISPTLSSARLVDRRGAAVAGTKSIAGGSDPRLLEMEEPALEPGTYGVLWRVLAEDDGHTSSGTVVFSVGAANGPLTVGAGSGSATTALDVTRRWIGLTLLAGLIGGLAVTGLVLARIGRSADSPFASSLGVARRRILAMAGGCAAVGALVGAVDAIEEARRLSTPAHPWTAAIDDLVFSTRWGHLWLAREAALILLAPIVLTIRARDAHPTRARMLACFAVALVVALVSAEALNSHAATVSSARDAAMISDAAHILAACVWLGALPALALILWSRDGNKGLVRACAGPFTRLVATSVALVLATGLYNAGREVASVGDLVTTSYGRTLLLKSGLLILMVGLGLVNAARLHEVRSAGRLEVPRSGSLRLVELEALVGAVLLIAVGVLVNTAPARSPAQVAEVAGRTGSASVADLFVTVSVTPNRPGVNGFTVLTASSRRPPPAPIDGVSLELIGTRGPTLVRLAPTAPGTYFGTGQFDGAVGLQLRVVAHRGGSDLTATVRWQVDPVPATHPATAHRLAPYVNVLAVLVIAAFAGSAWALYRRRRPAEPAAPASDAEPKVDSLV